jgi:hypothetical protein
MTSPPLATHPVFYARVSVGMGANGKSLQFAENAGQVRCWLRWRVRALRLGYQPFCLAADASRGGPGCAGASRIIH